ncbi:MAG: GntR family transcriptional regulator [Acidimicrobiales bacterium]|nr:GntR family transcriptional regulator [Acidimicrobiales bacterium]MDG1877690.1 GntR family transcriptional regulator [Acidimicrobiales bacterium]
MSGESLTHTAYLLLRDMIVTLELPPGAVLSQEDLQERTGLGRTPIHQALQRLEHEEFVVVIPRRGAFVTNVDVLELPVLYESRALLEPYMAREAARRGAISDWDEMAAVLDELKASATFHQRVAVDRRCHELIWAASGNRFLGRTVDALYAQSDRLWHMHLIEITDMRTTIEEHRQMLAVLRSGDGDAAAALMADHIRSLHDQISAVIGSSLRPVS